MVSSNDTTGKRRFSIGDLLRAGRRSRRSSMMSVPQDTEDVTTTEAASEATAQCDDEVDAGPGDNFAVQTEAPHVHRTSADLDDRASAPAGEGKDKSDPQVHIPDNLSDYSQPSQKSSVESEASQDSLVSEPQTPEEQATKVWINSYDKLRNKNPSLVLSYNDAIVKWLRVKNLNPETLEEPLLTDCSGTDIAAGRRCAPLARVVDIMREEQESDPETDSEPESDPGLDSGSHREEDPEPEPESSTGPKEVKSGEECNDATSDNSTGSEASRPRRGLLGGALRLFPHAPIPWAVAYVTLQSLRSPNERTEYVQSRILSVVSKTQWFSELFRLFFWSGQRETSLKPTCSTIDALTALFESFLSFHMYSVVYESEYDLCKAMGLVQEDGSAIDSLLDSLWAAVVELVSKFDRLGLAQKLLGRFSIDRKGEEKVPDYYGAIGHIPDQLYDWASQTKELKRFTTWDSDGCPRVLWVDGAPGTGKTMLLLATVRRLQKEALASPDTTKTVSSFFCAAWHRQNLLHALKSLVTGVAENQPHLREHLDKIRAQRGDFNDEGDTYTLSMILYRMLQDEEFESTYFVIDGVEKFLSAGSPASGSTTPITDRQAPDLYQLRHLITTTLKLSRKVKWLLSVECELGDPRPTFAQDHEELRLGLDASEYPALCKIATEYTDRRIEELCKAPGFNIHIKSGLKKRLKKARGNFLLINIALDSAKASPTPWSALTTLDSMMESKASIEAAYLWNLDSIKDLQEGDSRQCLNMLHAAATAYRPLPVSELAAIIQLPKEVNPCYLIEKFFPALLEIGEQTVIGKTFSKSQEAQHKVVSFRHHTARVFVQRELKDEGIRKQNKNIAHQCLRLLLHQMDCQCPHINIDLDEELPEPGFGLIAILWVNHLSELGGDNTEIVSLAVHLLSVHLREWLKLLSSRDLVHEAFSMMPRLRAKISAMEISENTNDIPVSPSQIVQEAMTFMTFWQKWKALPEDEQKWEENPDVLNDHHSLLFMTGVPFLRQSLLPKVFPRLKEPPLLEEFDHYSLHSLKHADWARGCCFLSNGVSVVSGSDEGLVRIWDAQTGNLQHVFPSFDEYVLGVVSPCPENQNDYASHLIAAFDYKRIKLMDASTGNILKVWPPQAEVESTSEGAENNEAENSIPDKEVKSIAISNSGDRLAAIIEDTLTIWSLADGMEYRQLAELSAVSAADVVFSSDGRLLASAAGSKITIWDAGDDLGSIVRVLSSHAASESKHEIAEDKVTEGSSSPPATDPSASVISVSLEGSADPDSLPSSESKPSHEITETGASDAATVSDTAEAQDVENTEHAAETRGLSFSPDSKFLASGSEGSIARVWELDSGKTVALLDSHASWAIAVCFSPDGRWVATGAEDGRISLWKQNAINEWGNGEMRYQPDFVLRGHSNYVLSISFSSLDNRTLMMSASADRSARIWDMNAVERDTSAGKVMESNKLRAWTTVACVAISPDGNMVASSTRNGAISLWDLHNSAPRQISEDSHQSEVLSMSFSPDGTLLVTSSMDRTALVWETSGTTATPLKPILRLQHDNWIRGAQFDPQSKLLAAGDDDRLVRVYDLSGARGTTTGTEDGLLKGASTITIDPIRTFTSHRDYVHAVAFSPDSKLLASGGDDARLLIWDLSDEASQSTPLHDIKSPSSYSWIRGVCFSNDGTKLVSVSDTYDIMIWNPKGAEGQQCRILEGEREINHFRSLRIHPHFPDLLLTEHGAMRIDLGDDEEDTNPEGRQPAASLPSSWPPIRIDKGSASITWGSDKNQDKKDRASSDSPDTIFLPKHLRPSGEPFSCRVQESLVVIGCESGDLLRFRFVDEEPSVSER